MRALITTTFFLLTIQLTVANDIDNLKTQDDVKNFLIEKVDTNFRGDEIFDTNKEDSIRYGKGQFFKLDLDNNGLTDLLINAKYFFAITDNGNKTYIIHFIDRGTFLLNKHTLKKIVYQKKIPLLLIQEYSEYWAMTNNPHSDTIHTDTLVFKFGNFYEYNPAPDKFKIEEINFSTSPCFGTCPIFELMIKSDRSSRYNAIEYNDKKGKFKTIIDTTSFDNLIQTINYIKLALLKDEYSVNWTDDQTATLEIKFNNGQTKKITDYGEIGTFGLEHLYDQLFALRKTQKWK